MGDVVMGDGICWSPKKSALGRPITHYSKYNSNCEKQITLLMIPNEEN